MDANLDYSAYTLDELLEERKNIDADLYPQRVKQLSQLIATKPRPLPIEDYYAVQFHGNSKEYFSIWIVNLLLSIATLGIYSAWAKVRTNRYFYANLELDGHRFNYLAQPMQILKGRIIALILFGGFYLASTMSPLIGASLVLLMMVFSPMLICMSLKFNMKMTRYRNIRFSFSGRYSEAFLVFIVYPILSIFTLCLTLPFAFKRIDQFIYDNIHFGNTSLRTRFSGLKYFLYSMGAFLVAAALLAIGGYAGIFVVEAATTPKFDMAYLLFIGGYVFVMTIASSFYTASVRNHIFANIIIENVCEFYSDIEIMDLILLRITNLLALICTLGFALPWVKVRTTIFMADCTAVAILPQAEKVLTNHSGSCDALGDEACDIFNINVAIG